jgi:hypothetical protein
MTTDEYIRELEELLPKEQEKLLLKNILSYTREYVAAQKTAAVREEAISRGRRICARTGRNPEQFSEETLIAVAGQLDSDFFKSKSRLEETAVRKVLERQEDLEQLETRVRSGGQKKDYTLDTSGMSGYALRWEQNGNIREIKRALEQGRMYIFPCRPGETVWEVKGLSGGIASHVVEDIVVSGFPRQTVQVRCQDRNKDGKPYILTLQDFDRTVFTSQTAAKECYHILQYEEAMRTDRAMTAELPAVER